MLNFWTRLRHLVLDVPIGWKILGIGVGIPLLFGSVTLGVVKSEFSTKLVNDLIASGELLAEDLSWQAEDRVAVGDTLAVHRLLADAKKRHTHVLYAMVLDRFGRVIAHTFEKRVPRDLLDFGRVPPEDTAMQYLESEQERFWEIRAPLLGGIQGQVRLGISERRVEQALNGTTLRILGTLGACCAVGVFFVLLLTRALTRPIHGLVEVTDRVGKGVLSVNASVYCEDEIGSLAGSLNKMIGELRHYRREVEKKEEGRTKLLQKLITIQEDERKRVARELHDA